ncbi:MAG: hypothetical protein K0R98_194 [Rickettsiaceae bacterium]|nr:hypothetical protein [Rickettsiaceae bacterium]
MGRYLSVAKLEAKILEGDNEPSLKIQNSVKREQSGHEAEIANLKTILAKPEIIEKLNQPGCKLDLSLNGLTRSMAESILDLLQENGVKAEIIILPNLCVYQENIEQQEEDLKALIKARKEDKNNTLNLGTKAQKISEGNTPVKRIIRSPEGALTTEFKDNFLTPTKITKSKRALTAESRTLTKEQEIEPLQPLYEEKDYLTPSTSRSRLRAASSVSPGTKWQEKIAQDEKVEAPQLNIY